MKTFAYAWASGLIQFGKTVPEGALPIISGQEDDVKNILIAISRHSRTNDDLLVPGVPEAANQHLALDAFMKFSDWARRDYAQLMKKRAGSSDEEYSIEIIGRFTSGTYIARYQGKQASNTASAKDAVHRLAGKIFGPLQRVTVTRISADQEHAAGTFRVTVDETQKCRRCGCTWRNACAGGCHWVSPNLCSACVDSTDSPEVTDEQ